MYCFNILTVILAISVGCVECHHKAACPTYWTNRGDFCYRLYSTEKTWVDAEAFCKTIGAPNGQGIAHLASVHSADEQQDLYDYWKTHRNEIPSSVVYSSNTEYPGLWIGLNDIAHNRDWRYTDGSTVDYTNWLNGEPNNCCGGEAAVHMWDGPHHNGGWNDIAHNSQEWTFPFICKMPASSCH
ncbi:C-type lectin [Holothuria leucospilota]|uniref:C-type lectin n=1 Tax=Holothuria leucospilota TaxID=206669 RepID=A0A9Q1CDJ8_HOLLE|nr:C-type lectin [Holothuria leucospilota]